ncbi:hypothetical protein [Microbacterium sp.]|uniref:hypothetical protein n=1 Tax=Microbacterium sp. TaxID=51671 RepID=UPI0039E5DDBA
MRWSTRAPRSARATRGLAYALYCPPTPFSGASVTELDRAALRLLRAGQAARQRLKKRHVTGDINEITAEIAALTLATPAGFESNQARNEKQPVHTPGHNRHSVSERQDAAIAFRRWIEQE